MGPGGVISSRAPQLNTTPQLLSTAASSASFEIEPPAQKTSQGPLGFFGRPLPQAHRYGHSSSLPQDFDINCLAGPLVLQRALKIVGVGNLAAANRQDHIPELLK